MKKIKETKLSDLAKELTPGGSHIKVKAEVLPDALKAMREKSLEDLLRPEYRELREEEMALHARGKESPEFYRHLKYVQTLRRFILEDKAKAAEAPNSFEIWKKDSGEVVVKFSGIGLENYWDVDQYDCIIAAGETQDLE